MKTAFVFIVLQIHHPMMRERQIDLGMFVEKKEGDVDDKSDVELDGNDQLDLDLEQNDNDLESDLLSDSEDSAENAEEFQSSPTFPEQVISLRTLTYYTPPNQLRFSNFSLLMILLLKWLSRPTSMLFKEKHYDHSSQYLMGS